MNASVSASFNLRKREKYLAFGTPDFTDAEVDAVARVMRSGWVGMGPETIAFERELSDYTGAPEVVTVNSCTSALFLALLVEGISGGDEVIVPSLTWCATANAALYLGATPVFCDVDPHSLCMTPESVVEKLSPRTKAVIVVHYGGYAVDTAAIREAVPLGVTVIEDAAHALGAVYPDGKRVGASGNIVCFSFYANKNISTADGGALALFDALKAERLRSLRLNGLSSHAWSRFVNPSTAFVQPGMELGYKMNFTDLQAAIGRVQLQRINEMYRARRSVANSYLNSLSTIKPRIPFQLGVESEGHALHLLVGLFDPDLFGFHRDRLLLALRERNIGASLHYNPLHLQPFYQRLGKLRLPVTEKLYNQILTLPIGASMSEEDAEFVTRHLVEIISHGKNL